MLKFAKATDRKERYSASSIESYHIEDRGRQKIYRKTSADQYNQDLDSISISSCSTTISRNSSFQIDTEPISDSRSSTPEHFSLKHFHRSRSHSKISEEDIDALNNVDLNENIIISNVKLTKRKPAKKETGKNSRGRACYVVHKTRPIEHPTDNSSTEFNYGNLEFHKPSNAGSTCETTDLSPDDICENYAFTYSSNQSPYRDFSKENDKYSEANVTLSKSNKKKNSRSHKRSEVKKAHSFKALMPKKFLRSSTVGHDEKLKSTQVKEKLKRSSTDGEITIHQQTQQKENQAPFQRFSDTRQNIRKISSTTPRRRNQSRASSKSSSVQSDDSFGDDLSILTTVSSAASTSDDIIFKTPSPNLSPMTYSDRSFSCDSEFPDMDDERLSRIQFRKQRLHKFQRKYLHGSNEILSRGSTSSPDALSADSQYGGSCSSLSDQSLHYTSTADISTLPDGLLLLIFSYLSTREICTISQVCKKWKSLYLSEELWERMEITDNPSLDIDDTLNMLLQRLAYNTSCLSIQQIKLDGCSKLSDTGLKTIALRCPELRAIELVSCLKISPDGVFHILKNCPNMMYMNLSQCDDLTGFSVQFNFPSKVYERTFGELRYLDVSSCSALTDDDLTAILQCFVSLEYLYLRRCDCISDIGLESVAEYCSNLKEISLNDCFNITDKGVTKIIRKCRYLRYVSLAKCSITNAVLEQIAKTNSSYLRHLNLYSCEAITDTGIMKLSATCLRLRSMDIGKCTRLTDASLYGLSRCVLLRRVNLKCCVKVTDAGVRKLATVCRNLQNVDLRGCLLSPETLLYIKRHCNMCDVEWLSAHLC